jgi:hypothetical protein
MGLLLSLQHENGIMPDIKIEFKELEIPSSLLPDPYNTDNQIISILEDYKTNISQLK